MDKQSMGLEKERLQAIRILEHLAEAMGKEKMFDSNWYLYEDLVYAILTEDSK